LNIHEDSARRFTDLVRERLGRKLRAVVLYGSVARGEAHEDSDVDLLVVTDPPPVLQLIDEVAYDVDFAAQFTTFLIPIELTPEQIREWIHRGDPFLETVLEEGMVLEAGSRAGLMTNHYETIDTRLSKNFVLRRKTIIGSVDVFNLLNLSQPLLQNYVTSKAENWRVPLRIQAPRSLQLGIRHTW
jgi:predicted nucleotidyltransferase